MDNIIANNNLISNLPEERGWEFKQICVTRVPGYGFGIAVSGGRDNPHFASGDPSIAVSDVLASGPAERILQVNDRIISVNGISLQNVDYATAVQVLRDSGDTVTLVVKRRTIHHQHSHSLSASYSGPPLAALGLMNNPGLTSNKVTLTKNSKKEDFGIVLGCKLFVKEISSKAREQLMATNQVMAEGDFITKVNNTNCSDLMSIKEAKKIIDGSKDKLQITIAKDSTGGHHQVQSSVSTTGAVNNFYKGDDFLTSSQQQSYSNQNLYVQPPTRNPNLNNSSGGFDNDKMEPNSGPNSLVDDTNKSNLAPRGGRSRGPLCEANLDQRNSMAIYGRSKEPPRPPPPRAEDYYSSSRRLYEDDPIIQKKQPIPDARFVTFLKEGSVGIRLTGGNFVGIFVTAVQPGSPASLQGLQPGDKILKVNDMDMTGVTREEAVLFLLSLQDRIELIVQYCKEEYDTIVASQKGDSFYIKTHFHYDNPAKGEMSFRSGDIFHVIDTLYNGVVGSWQVFRIGRNNQEVQKGIIPNKARAEEMATAQFNATKKEMSANESRGSFFRRRRSSNRRSKSLGKEHWDDILFSDTVSKFPAYERVLLKHPGFTRPVILFGPISDVARSNLLKDFPDKFISPQLDFVDDHKSQKTSSNSNIIRLSAIRDVISTGKHALLDITPNAVERLNYAQMYPIVVFFKAETKIVVKQLRQGLPKSAHKSSKKLLEQCQKLDKVWNHVFSATITMNDNTDNWYRKVRDIIDKQQTGALWMSESKPEESLSDDFLFPMSSLRLSYASSPESDLEHSPGPAASSNSPTAGRLTKASSDPSVVMPDSSTTDVLPPYQPNYDSRYGFNNNNNNNNPQSPTIDPQGGIALTKEPSYTLSTPDIPGSMDQYGSGGKNIYGTHNNNNTDYSPHHRQQSTLHQYNMNNHNNTPQKEGIYGQVPDLPPRIDRAVKPIGLLTPSKIPNGRSAHERLFGTKPNQNSDGGGGEANEKSGSLERGGQNSKSDSLSSYDSFNKPTRIGPNAHDDLKTTLSKIDQPVALQQTGRSGAARWEGAQLPRSHHQSASKLDLKYGLPPSESPRNSREMEVGTPSRGSVERDNMYRYKSPGKSNNNSNAAKGHIETKTDYGKYSRNNNSSSQDYARSSQQDLSQAHLLSIPPPVSMIKGQPLLPQQQQQQMNGFDHHHPTNGHGVGYKPVPPPKPKNYKPPVKGQQGYEGVMQPQMPYQHGKTHSNPVDQRPQNMNYYYNMPQQPPQQNTWHTETAVRYNTDMHGHYDMAPPYERRHPSISYASRSEITPIAQNEQHNYPMECPNDILMDARPPERNTIVDLQGSREQRGSAFELYRKPMHHNLRNHQQEPDVFGSQPNIPATSHKSKSSTTNNSAKVTPNKLTKAQSFKHPSRSEGLSARLFRKFSFKKPAESPKALRKHPIADERMRPSKRDITSAVVDSRGATMINEYWGVSLVIPEDALPSGERREIYFVVSDPRLCDNADRPPLDHENGETMLSPMVMCGPQGTEFLKPVILNIPHYANTLPSLGITLKATDSEQDVHTDWDNILLPSNHAANSVAVKVDHF